MSSFRTEWEAPSSQASGLAPLQESGDDVDQLVRTFQAMMNRIEALVDEVYRIEVQEAAAELMALQAQINPHFLYNTLDSIKSCLDGGKQKRASDMIVFLPLSSGLP